MKRNNVTAFMSIAGGRVAVIMVSALVTPLLTRNMTQAQYGAYGVIMAIFGLLMILVSSGINSGVRKYLAEKRDEANWTSNVFGYYFRIASVLAVVPAVVLAGLAYTGVVSRIGMFGPAYVPYFYLLAVLTLAAQFREYVRRALMGLELEHISEPIKVLHKVAFGVFAVSLVLLAPPDLKVMGVLAAEILASSLAAAVAFYFISTRVTLSNIFGGIPADFPRRELISFNSLTVVYIFLLTSLYHVDVLMVQGIINSQTAGIYKGALVIVEFLWLVPRSMQSVMIQSASGHWADGNVEKINEMASQATRYTLLFTLLLAIGLGALATTFVPFYLGAKYSEAVLPVLLLLPGTIGFAIARPIFAISHAKGELKVVIAATGAAAVLNLTLNALLIPRYGMLGAAVSTSIGYGSLPFFHVFGARHIGFKPFRNARVGRIVLTAVLTGVPILLLSLVFGNSLLGLFVVPPVGFVLFSAFTLLTGALDVDEVLSVLVALPAPIGPRARRLRGRVRDSSGIAGLFGSETVRSYAARVAIVVAIIAIVAGLSLAMGLERPEVDVSPNATSTPTQTPYPTASPTEQPPPTGEPTPTKGASPTPSRSPTPTAAGPPTGTASPSPSPTPTDDGLLGGIDSTPTPTPTDGGGGSPGGGGTPTPGRSPTPTPTASSTSPTPTATPTASPTAGSSSPTPTPTASPTASSTSSTPTQSTASTTGTTETTTAGGAATTGGTTTTTGENTTTTGGTATGSGGAAAALVVPFRGWMAPLVAPALALVVSLAEAVGRLLALLLR